MSNDVESCSLQNGVLSALHVLLQTADGVVSSEVRVYLRTVSFDSTGCVNDTSLRCPRKETEAITALMTVEASVLGRIRETSE